MLASFLEDLGIIDCTILQHIDGDRFTLLHANDVWFTSLLSTQNPIVGHDIFFEDDPIFLIDFLYDAKEFWQLNTNGRINSGIWSEKTERGLWRLEAAAITRDANHYLVISNLENEFNKRQGTLQIARELLISNDRIIEQHEHIRARLENLSTPSQCLEELQIPIKKVIEKAEFGVAIVNNQMQPVEQNPALYRLFDVQKQEIQSPVELVLDLCERQFPEFQRILETASHWSGELYWLKANELSRWLHLTICPVKDNVNSITYWLFLITDVSREKYLQQSNEKLTYFDVLTGLPNRQYFWQSLKNAINSNRDFFILQIDVKHLKRINETYGYSVGDQVIKEMVNRLQPLVKEHDVLARIGGNEFSVIIRESEQDRCEEIGNQFIAAIKEPFSIYGQYQCNVSLNIGAAHYPKDSSSAEDLMKYADLAAFTVKAQNENCIKFYSTDLKENLRKQNEIEVALRNAINEKQFELYLQPVLDLESGDIVKAEALIRWNRPSIGMVPPDEFIPIAEQTGLILSIGQWVIEEATKILSELHQQDKPIKLSVNLSPAQVNDSNLLKTIRDSVATNNIDASYLELELTEGVLVDDFDKIRLFLEEVRNMGISVAIDDFGTGYSSLSYLQKLPIDHLKIDRSFIGELTGSESNRAIVLAVIAMAKGLNLGVIAEGVENEDQQQFLRDNDCQAAQGYLFSRPVPVNKFRDLFKK